MKRYLIYFVWVLLPDGVDSQPIVFNKLYSGNPGNGIFGYFQFVQTSNGDIILGNTGSLLKLDEYGNQIWRKEMLDSTNEQIAIVAFCENYSSGFLTAGRAILSLDSIGNIDWIKNTLCGYPYVFFDMDKGFNLNYYLLGDINLNSPLSSPLLTMLDSSGDIVWAKVYNSLNNLQASVSLAKNNSGGVVIVCASRSLTPPNFNFDAIVFSVDSVGSVQWSYRYNSPNTIYFPKRILRVQDGGYLISGTRNLQAFIMKIDSLGIIQWTKSFAIGLIAQSKDIIETVDNGYLMTGQVTDTVSGGSGMTAFLLKTDSLFNVQWARTISGFGDILADKVETAVSGGYLVAGQRFDLNGDLAINIIRTDSMGIGDCLNGTLNVTAFSFQDTMTSFVVTDSLIMMTSVLIAYNFPNVGTELDICNYLSIHVPTSELNVQLYPNPNSGSFIIEATERSQKIELFDICGKQIPIKTDEVGNITHISIPDVVINGAYLCKIAFKNKFVSKLIFVNEF